METCERCGIEFDYDDAEALFDDEYCPLMYDRLTKALCFTCAKEAMEAMEDGIYVERCERCGKEFDYFADSVAVSSNPEFLDANLLDVWSETGQILCAQCAGEDLPEVYPIIG